MNKDEALTAIRAAMNTLTVAQSSVRDASQPLANDIYVDVDPNRVSVLSSGVVVCQPQLLGSPLSSPELMFLPLPPTRVIKICPRCKGTGVEPP